MAKNLSVGGRIPLALHKKLCDFAAEMKADKLKAKLLQGNVANWSFADACLVARHCGWGLSRVCGSHHIFTHTRAEVPSLNLQEKQGQAKSYQLRQMKDAIENHRI